MEALAMHQLKEKMAGKDSFVKDRAEKIAKCLAHLCKWVQIETECWAESHVCWLMGLLRDSKITSFMNNKPSPTLSPKSYEVVRALELVASSQGWEWTNNHLIIQHLWPVLKDWRKSLTVAPAENRKDETPGDGSLAADQQMTCIITTAMACAVIKIIGSVGQIGLVTNVQSVEQLMSMLIKVLQQPPESIPWPMQLYTAHSIYDLSPSDERGAAKALRKWVYSSANAVPAKFAEQIGNLGRKMEEPSDDVMEEACAGKEEKEKEEKKEGKKKKKEKKEEA